MKLSSNVGAAQDAVSEFAAIALDSNGRQVSLGSSNIASIHDGATVANTILRCLVELVAGVTQQADNVTALAMEIEQRDSRDAGSWGGKS